MAEEIDETTMMIIVVIIITLILTAWFYFNYRSTSHEKSLHQKHLDANQKKYEDIEMKIKREKELDNRYKGKTNEEIDQEIQDAQKLIANKQ